MLFVVLTHSLILFYFVMLRPIPSLPVYPYTTLFRSTLLDVRPIEPLDVVLVEDRRHGLDGLELRTDLEAVKPIDRKSTRLNSSHLVISYAVIRVEKKITRYRRESLTETTTSDIMPVI